jgi:hypothetical protein
LKTSRRGVALSDIMIALFVGSKQLKLSFLGGKDWEIRLKESGEKYTPNNAVFADSWSQEKGNPFANLSQQKICFKRLVHVGAVNLRRFWMSDPGLAHLFRERFQKQMKLKMIEPKFPWFEEKRNGNLVCAIVLRHSENAYGNVRDIENPSVVGRYISKQIRLLGFKINSCHTFVPQAAAFHSMDVIISVDGSQLVNLIFSRRSTIVILFHVPLYPAFFEYNTYSELESELGLSFLHFRSMNKSLSSSSDFGSNFEKFDEYLKNGDIRDSLIRVSSKELEYTKHIWRNSLINALKKLFRERAA